MSNIAGKPGSEPYRPVTAVDLDRLRDHVAAARERLAAANIDNCRPYEALEPVVGSHCPGPRTMSTATAHGSSDSRGAASLRAGRKFDSAPKIVRLIDHNMMEIKQLVAQCSTRPAGRELTVLRETAGRLGDAITQRSLMV